ncbi:MAG: endo-1,4-beta-xylanase [Chitinophagaceae bacterium]|jgi:endo-1,4-beta-xylanase|nr:endo-1,4-beta-xylanase [Chitinophagaceae bacterium]
MNKIIKYPILALLVAGVIGSCTKMKEVGILNTGNFGDTSGTLQSAANGMNIGFGVYQGDTRFPQYFPIVVREANQITPGNEMKYGSIVQNDGTLNFTNADALFNQATSAGLSVFGHNLLWYQQQNTAYLNTIASTPSAPSVLSNGSFETWTTATSAPDGWSYYNGSTYFSQATGANAQDGNYAIAAAGYGAANGSDWHVQMARSFPTTPGHTYNVTFYAMGSASGGRVQFEWQDPSGTQYNAVGISTSYSKYTEGYGNPMTATGSSVTLTFDLAANPVGTTVYLDNVVVTDQATVDSLNALADPVAVAARVDSVMKLWIVGTSEAPGIVTHYAGKIPAWDVANEVLSDNPAGALRTSKNTNDPPAGTSYFFWTEYLGKAGIVDAFKYAHEADPAAKLFINDYNLEYSQAKVDSLVALVAYIKAQGGQVDGIGTQMHVDAKTSSYSGIDYMFQQLAATGLLIHISELDVTIAPSVLDPTVADPVTLASQAAMYKFIVSEYLKYIPAAQRYGITIWGVDDPDSWRASQLPLLWDANFAKKPAYSGVLQALQGK